MTANSDTALMLAALLGGRQLSKDELDELTQAIETGKAATEILTAGYSIDPKTIESATIDLENAITRLDTILIKILRSASVQEEEMQLYRDEMVGPFLGLLKESRARVQN